MDDDGMDDYDDLGDYDGLDPSADDRWAQWRANGIREGGPPLAPRPPPHRRPQAAEPLAEWKKDLWFTSREAQMPKAELVHSRRLRHAVSKDVALACAQVRVQREWRVDTGRQIGKAEIERLASPRAGKRGGAARLPQIDMSPAAIERMRRQRVQDSSRKAGASKAGALKKEQLARWKATKTARTLHQATVAAPPPRAPLSARVMRERGERAVKGYLERQEVRRGKTKLIQTERAERWEEVNPSPAVALGGKSKVGHSMGVGIAVG